MISTMLLAAAIQVMPTLAPPSGPACPRANASKVGDERPSPGSRPLSQEPAARSYRSVMRYEAGCEKLVPVSGEPVAPPAPVLKP